MRRVGLNLLYLLPGAVGGTEIYARELVRALAHARPETELLAYCARDAVAGLAGARWPANVALRPLPVRAAVKPERILGELTLLPLRAARDRVELLHSLGTTSPPVARCPCVVTVQDLIYDRFPATFPLPARAGLRVLVPLGARRALRVIVASEASRRDVRERLRVPIGRVDVVPMGPGAPPGPATPERDLRERLRLGDAAVLLCVSAALEHKNLPRLLRAFAGLADADARLVLAGHHGREAAHLRALADALGLGGRFVQTGWIPDTDLEGLYALATGFAYPSLLEGFGLPVLEAMRRGVPVACSDAGSLPEVAGDAALLFDGRSEAAIGTALATLLHDGEARERLIARGRARAALFTWEAAARATFAVYERAISASAARQ